MRTWALKEVGTFAQDAFVGDSEGRDLCCSLLYPQHTDEFSKYPADLCVMTWLLGYVDPSDPCFVAAILAITFNPLFWNVVARWEQKTRKLSRAFRSPYLACYSLGAAILLLNVLRSHCFTQAMLSQPKMESLDNPTAYRTGLALLGVGSAFVISSFLALGFTGTFLGGDVSQGRSAKGRKLLAEQRAGKVSQAEGTACAKAEERRGADGGWEGPLRRLCAYGLSEPTPRGVP
ncbi:phosphatidylethanolamine N-methyltransferase isoform X3 [Ursus americanus]|uniref:phosphatidylethanolamine N-methyltransferase isoform X3 n=1 Tax=Ursus americanus TaxID=9643 RepID=UPI001E67BACE|nr:phosphatidylethanolamine N-methyltransferase isoform X3 [Ursus americanus]